jgi:hypothetical protein
MKPRVVFVIAISVVAAGSAQAQSSSCPAGTGSLDPNRISQDACQMAVDVFRFMGPQLGVALAGGNATLGQGGALGGLGHFTVGLRANLLEGDLPQVQNFPNPSTSGVQPPRTLPSKKQFVGLPILDAAVGVFKGLPLGLTNVGGVDLLLNASFIPTYGSAGDAVQVKPSQSLQLGFGARVGLLQESLLVPGVSATYMRRDLPTTTIIGTSSGVNVNVSDASVKTNAWRLTASKSLILFSLAAGVGRDSYDQTATVQGSVRTSPATSVQSQPIKLDQNMKRTTYFLDASLNMLLAKIVGEIGQVSGGTASTYNSFSGGAADKSRLYGSLGVRIGF